MKKPAKPAKKSMTEKKKSKQAIDKKPLPKKPIKTTPKTELPIPVAPESKLIQKETAKKKIPVVDISINDVIEKRIEEPIIEAPAIEEKQEMAPAIPEEKIDQSAKEEIAIPQSDPADDKNKVESLLFAYGKYIDESMISELCNIDKRKLKKLLEELRKDYESRNNALAIFQEGNSWKINVREKYLSIVRKIVADTELPKSVMETLAVIAWKSPIYQSEVVRIRGNKCYDHIEILEDAGFIIKDRKGRSYVLKTTDKFFNYFEIDHGNLKSIFEEVKIPEIQKTLEPEENNIENKIENIELKKWAETEEEKASHHEFLSKIEGQIKEVQEKNKTLEEEIPSLKKVVIQPTDARPEEAIPELSDSQEMPDQNTSELIPQAEKKPKSLTKKQLEKKFKEDLDRVKEKMKK